MLATLPVSCPINFTDVLLIHFLFIHTANKHLLRVCYVLAIVLDYGETNVSWVFIFKDEEETSIYWNLSLCQAMYRIPYLVGSSLKKQQQNPQYCTGASLISFLYKWGEGRSERLSCLPKIIQSVSVKLEFEPRSVWFLCHTQFKEMWKQMTKPSCRCSVKSEQKDVHI